MKLWGAIAVAQTIKKIYLHWSATGYYWAEPGHYHTVVQGDGKVRRLTGYEYGLPAHTYRRNTNSVGLCIACMGGRITWGSNPSWEMPPTQKQVDALCQEVANLAISLAWTPNDISIKTVLTHAEAASNKDGWQAHENYGPTCWGGDGTRWDLLMLGPSEKQGSGGDRLREKIRAYMEHGFIQASVSNATPALQQHGSCPVLLNGKEVLKGRILGDSRCYLPLTELGKLYDFSLQYLPAERAIHLSRDNTRSPKYATDAPVIPGYPPINIYFGTERPVLQGVILGDRTWVSVSEFCNEFSIPCVWLPTDRAVNIGNLTDIPE